MDFILSGIAQWEIQAYLYHELSVDSELLRLNTGGVHDMLAPPSVDYPYTVIGDWTESDDSMQNNVGRQVTATLHVWDNYEGSKTVKAIGTRIAQILDRRQAVTPGWNLNTVYLEYVNNMLGAADRKQHLIMRFRFKVTRR